MNYKEMFNSFIILNNKIKNGKENNKITYQNYSKSVKPLITQFKDNFGNTPNMVLQEILKPHFDSLKTHISKNDVGYNLQQYSHYGNNILYEYSWACIHYRYPNIKALYASFSPQLYILVHANGIKYGFCYGAHIDDDSNSIKNVTTNTNILKLLFNLNKNINFYKLKKGASDLAEQTDILKISSTNDIINVWNKDIHIIEQFDKNNIPDNIIDLINEKLKTIFPVFKSICELNIQNPIFNHKSITTCTLPKPFILLAGISGTGKTRFVKKQAEASAKAFKISSGDNYCLIPVRPDWHEPSDLLGYISRINGTRFITTEFLRFIVKATISAAESVTEDTIDWKSPESIPPYWLCLDEMNLAPVEQYFADYLSILETAEWKESIYKSEPIMKHDVLEALEKSESESGKNALEVFFEDLLGDSAFSKHNDLCKYFKKNGIPLPPNLIVAGTVNMDETTHGFSRKVIDRALTIDFQEFFPNNFDSFFDGQDEVKTFTFPLYSNAEYERDKLPEIDNNDKTGKSTAFLNSINNVLAGSPFELAYRSLNELLLSVISFNPVKEEDLQAVWDDYLMQKILPRIEGDSQKLKYINTSDSNDKTSNEKAELDKKIFGTGTILHELYTLLGSELLKDIWDEVKRPDLLTESLKPISCRSKKKLEWMMRRLKNTHFTDFWV